MKEAHRNEVDSLQSKINSLTETIAELEKKQQELISNHRKEMDEIELCRTNEIGKLNEKISLLQVRLFKSGTFGSYKLSLI